jgi:hypothetical protein
MNYVQLQSHAFSHIARFYEAERDRLHNTALPFLRADDAYGFHFIASEDNRRYDKSAV